MPNYSSRLLTPRLEIELEPSEFRVYDRLDQYPIAYGQIETDTFHIVVLENSSLLGVATETSQALLQHVITNRPFIADIPNSNTGAIALCQRLGFHISKQNNEHTSFIYNNTSSLKNYEIQLVTKYLKQLKIDEQIKLPLHYRSCRLVSSGKDIFGRPYQLHPKADDSLQKMIQAANRQNIEISIVSGYRGYRYQAGLIEKKLTRGQLLSDILEVNVPPGYSEHHTGLAVDLTTKGQKPLEESFEKSDAFKWLTDHAANYQFYMSYPRDNTYGIVYEPWHWCYHPQNK